GNNRELRLGQLICELEPRGAIRGLNRIDRVPQRRRIRSESLNRHGFVVERDNHRGRISPHRADQLFRFFLRFVQPRLATGFNRIHRRRVVDEDDRGLSRAGRVIADGARKRQTEQRQQNQLKDQQQISPELLKWRVDLQILNGFLPEQRRRDHQLSALQLKKIKNQQRRNRNRGSDDRRE